MALLQRSCVVRSRCVWWWAACWSGWADANGAGRDVSNYFVAGVVRMLRCHWAAAQTWDSPYGSRWCSSSSAWVPYLVAVLLFVAGLVVLVLTVAILVLGVLLAG